MFTRNPEQFCLVRLRVVILKCCLSVLALLIATGVSAQAFPSTAGSNTTIKDLVVMEPLEHSGRPIARPIAKQSMLNTIKINE